MEKRIAILTTAIQNFATYGMSHVSLEEISFNSSVPLEEVLALYPTKADLMTAILAYIPKRLTHFEMSEREVRSALAFATPAEILEHFVSSYQWQNDLLYPSIYRLMYIEQMTDSRVSLFTFRQMLDQPIRNIKNVLDVMVQEGAIPPCDSQAIAEVWARTSLICGMLALHNNMDNQEFLPVTSLFIHMATKGVNLIRSPQWDTPPLPGNTGPDNDDLSKRIRHTALRLLSSHEYTQVTLGHIAQAAGIDAAELSRHYSSKADILKGMYNELYSQYSNWGSLAELPPKAINLSILFFGLSDANTPERQTLIDQVHKVMLSAQFLDPDLRDMTVHNLTSVPKWIETVLLAQTDHGAIDPLHIHYASIAFVYSMYSLAFDDSVLPEELKPTKDIRRRIATILLNVALHGYAS